MRNKIISAKKIIRVASKLKSEGQKIVYAQGFFDLFHIGHVHHLEQAKKLGDVLIVGVVADWFVKKGPGRPIFKEKERLKLVAALECVDLVVLNEAPDAIEAIKKIAPDIYAKGEDVKEKAANPQENLYREIKILETAGGKIHFTQSLPIHSTQLLDKFFNAKSASEQNFAQSLPIHSRALLAKLFSARS